jgi:ribosomal protein S18 acetylase RimI-like enzyme
MSTAPIRYTDELGGLSAADLVGFWEGWPTPPSPERHLRALRGSEIAVLAIDDSVGRVVGFVTAVGDGELAAFVPFLEVLPAYRGRGIGRELVRRALDRLGGRYAVDLICDHQLVPFYERLGFTRLTAMAIRDRDALAADGPPG